MGSLTCHGRMYSWKTPQAPSGSETDLDICPVKAVLEFIAVRGPGPGTFFTGQDGVGLTRAKKWTESIKSEKPS